MSCGEPKWWEDILAASAHWNSLSTWQQDEILRKQYMAKAEPFQLDVKINSKYNEIEVPIKKLTDDAILPTKAHEIDAGFDLYSIENVWINEGDIVKIKTGIATNIPPGYVGLIQDKSSIGSKGLKVYGGVIDAGYTGEIIVCLGFSRHEDDTIEILGGQKIAQLVILPLPTVKLKQVEYLDSTDRGEKGFGSSGS